MAKKGIHCHVKPAVRGALVAFLFASELGQAGCKERRPADPAATLDALAGTDAALQAIARAENLRLARAIPSGASTGADPAVRRGAARALARILDADDAPLLRALADEDEEVVAWAAFGLGESCKGRADGHVRALAARLLSLGNDAKPTASVRAVPTLIRAIGRCGGDFAEAALVPWLRRGSSAAEAAALAIGDVAVNRGGLADDTAARLLDAAQGSPALDAALYPFARAEVALNESISPRLLDAARAALARLGPWRATAVRAMGRANDPRASPPLAQIVASDEASLAERIEGVQALVRLRAPGQQALGSAVVALVHAVQREGEPARLGVRAAVLAEALGVLENPQPPPVEQGVWAAARLHAPAGLAPAMARRASIVRCAAAKWLARGAWDSDVLAGCDVADGEVGERARLEALERQSLARGKRKAWVELARSPHLRVREAALAAIAGHPELGPWARTLLAEALEDSHPGVVAAAAKAIQAHPDRVFVVAPSERHDALDAGARALAESPARELDAAVSGALRTAMGRPWARDLVETRCALVEAGLVTGIDAGRAYALAACTDSNATVRFRTMKALAAAGLSMEGCSAPSEAPEVAAELGRPPPGTVRVELDTDAGPLALRFDGSLAPVAVTRFVALARAGFYAGLSFHRVVPGFVAQFGDPGGDGYGGAGTPLRCETSPIAFEAFDIGVALAGRDTGSSQMFVTLARYPHLDGEYAWVGHAEGNWEEIAEGDVIHAVRVAEPSSR
jgi:cyclophilin family peptidyl-prolyl cis-trans isomerase